MGRCGQKTEVYSRVVGYYRPVTQWNKGKQEEFKARKVYDYPTGTGSQFDEDESSKEEESREQVAVSVAAV